MNSRFSNIFFWIGRTAIAIASLVAIGAVVQARAVPPDGCLAEFRQSYSNYLASAHQEIDHAYEGPERLGQLPHPARILFGTRPFNPNPATIRCAASRGDQLALYLNGKALIESPRDVGDVISGLGYLHRAATHKEGASRAC